MTNKMKLLIGLLVLGIVVIATGVMFLFLLSGCQTAETVTTSKTGQAPVIGPVCLKERCGLARSQGDLQRNLGCRTPLKSTNPARLWSTMPTILNSSNRWTSPKKVITA